MISRNKVQQACAIALIVAAAMTGVGAAPQEKVTKGRTPVVTLPPTDAEWTERAARFGGDEWVTRPSRDAALGFTLSIEIQELLIKPGQTVKQGQRLIRGRDGEILAGLEVQKLKANNNTEVRNAQAALDLAQSRFEAIDKVMQKDAGTKGEHDERRLNLVSAKIGVEAASKRLEEEVLRLAQAEEQAKRYVIEAPFDGVVDQLVAEVGQTVTEQDPIMRVVNIDPLWVDVPVKTDATIREKLEPGHEAWALLDLPGEPVILKGKVQYVSSVADAASGTRRVRVEMANPTRWPAATRTRVRFSEPSAEWTAFVQEGLRSAGADPATAAQIGGEKK